MSAAADPGVGGFRPDQPRDGEPSDLEHPDIGPPDLRAFDDVLAANDGYAKTFQLAGLPAVAGRGLAVVTCMDSRIEPLQMLGLSAGDAKILRNAGARVTADVLRTLVLAVHLLGVTRVMVVTHTKCRMAQSSDDEVHAHILRTSGVDSRSLEFGTTSDQEASLREDVVRIRAHPLLPDDLAVLGCHYDVDSGELTPVV